ncbi:alanine racemase [Erythrobacter sp. NE805]|uniref:alanine racemase n=1 Tax=Erythrobacter sp. NE805 TaxID=3389875 RepID=UPI00396B17C8
MLDHLHKSLPPWHEADDAIGARVLEGDLLFPVAVLREDAIAANRAWMRSFLEATGVSIAPHGKTSMSPELFAMQIADGAWGMTAATAHHVRLYHHLGIRRVIHANQLVGAADIRLALDLLAGDPGFELYSLVDSLAGVERLAAAHRQSGLGRPLCLLLEMGAPGGRTGVRSREEGIAVARAVAAAPGLALSGVEVFEGVFQGQPDGPAKVEAMLDDVLALATTADAEGLYAGEEIILTGGGSAFFDRCARRLVVPTLSRPVRTVIRSGCYISHDDNLYRRLFAELLEREPSCAAWGDGLQAALEVWAPVQSVPEPGRIIAALGKRDAGYDAGLPLARFHYRPGVHAAPVPIEGELVITGLYDQHAVLEGTLAVEVGDVLGFGISHPCTTFDRWRALFLVDEARQVTGHVTTLF